VLGQQLPAGREAAGREDERRVLRLLAKRLAQM
jgi:hypothetical protein